MRLKNVLIAVRDLERSKAFYREFLGLHVIMEREGNVILTEGLVLQEEEAWEKEIGKNVVLWNHGAALYFEERDLESFVKRLKEYREPIEFVNELTELPWGQKVVRFYDPDRNLIEVRTEYDNL